MSISSHHSVSNYSANNQSDIDRDDITDIANSQSDIDRDDSKRNEYIIYNTDGFGNGNTIHPVYDHGSDGGD